MPDDDRHSPLPPQQAINDGAANPHCDVFWPALHVLPQIDDFLTQFSRMGMHRRTDSIVYIASRNGGHYRITIEQLTPPIPVQ